MNLTSADSFFVRSHLGPFPLKPVPTNAAVLGHEGAPRRWRRGRTARPDEDCGRGAVRLVWRCDVVAGAGHCLQLGVARLQAMRLLPRGSVHHIAGCCSDSIPACQRLLRVNPRVHADELSPCRILRLHPRAQISAAHRIRDVCRRTHEYPQTIRAREYPRCRVPRQSRNKSNGAKSRC